MQDPGFGDFMMGRSVSIAEVGTVERRQVIDLSRIQF
jgi:hypothetical protein